jgi:hypothetical protein
MPSSRSSGALLEGAVEHRVDSAHRTGRQPGTVQADVVDPHIPALVIGFLVVMVAATVVLAVVADADGARHPSIMASVVVAVAVAFCGPALLAAVRRRLEQRAVA